MLFESAAEGFMERRAGSVDVGLDGNKDELMLRKFNLGSGMCLRGENVIQGR